MPYDPELTERVIGVANYLKAKKPKYKEYVPYGNFDKGYFSIPDSGKGDILDCSGFVHYCFYCAGLEIPGWTGSEEWNFPTSPEDLDNSPNFVFSKRYPARANFPNPGLTEWESREEFKSNAQRGDVLFIAPDERPGVTGHEAIYIGNGKFIHSGSCPARSSVKMMVYGKKIYVVTGKWKPDRSWWRF